ncbi:hypothetical protein DPMN_164883 [Dreissena polymorpha]|uniref:Uncharacterized protein n=1 Tax=Dreissena polymorpha TaxID=45954 RepID=A0A9D4ETR4_DREPO|nr:hypothetical protein DPMN_164883 [Dreissena polymorpha]
MTPGHILHRPHHLRGSQKQSQENRRTYRRSADHCQITETKVVWASLTIIRKFPRQCYKAQYRDGGREEDKGKDGKITLQNALG